MTWTLLLLALAGLFAYLKYQRFWVGQFTPDCGHYLDLAKTGKSFAPYCYRPTIPTVAALLAVRGGKGDLEDAEVWLARIGTTGIVLVPLTAAWLALELGAPWPAAAAVVLVLVCSDHLFGLSLTMPWHIDPPAMALSLAVCALWVHGEPWALFAAGAGLGLLAGVKESHLALTGAFLLALDPTRLAAWVCVGIAGLAHLGVRWRAKPVPTDNPWLLHPFKTATVKKAPTWGLYAWGLGALEATPWVAALALVGSPLAFPAAVVGVLAWAQTTMATDQGRLTAMCLPWLAACVAATASPWLLAVWVMLSVAWPLKKQDILG